MSSGINVVTTRSEFFYAAAMDPTVRQRIEQACRQGGSSIHATGSSPGFSTTTMPLTLVYPMRRLDEVTIDEYAYIPASVGPDMILNVMHFGAPVDRTEMDSRLLQGTAIGYKQSLTAFADAVGLPLDGFEVRGDIARAIPYVVEAAPGIRTIFDLPPIVSRFSSKRV